MRVLIVTPRQPHGTGNQTTALRLGEGLRGLGWAAGLVEASEDPTFLDQEVSSFKPDVLLLLHAYRTGRLWLDSIRAWRLPAATLLTGTDVHGGLHSPTEGPVIREVLRRAVAAIIQNRLTFEALRRNALLFSRLQYLPPGVVLGSAPYPLRLRHGIRSDEILFLHPAGIRPVKGNLELLHLFDPIAARDPAFRVAFCGPILDAEYGRRFLNAVAKRSWALHLGTVPPSSMAAALADSDVVLNNSLSEGMPNALLEAAVLGRPVLARDIPGNAAAVDEEVNGFLFRTPEEFAHRALALIERPELRQRLSRPRPGAFNPEKEASVLDSILRNAIGRK